MIPESWQRAMLSGELFDPPPKPKPENPYDSEEYAAFVEYMAKHCQCEPAGARPCDGVLAGGLCDRMDWTERFRYDNDSED